MQETNVVELLERHRAFWRREKVDRPLVSIRQSSPLAPQRIPLAGGTWADGGLHLLPDMLDARALAAFDQRHGVPGHLLLGDSFSVRTAYSRIPWMEAILGCALLVDGISGSLWSQPFLRHPRELGAVVLLQDNPWYHKLLELTRVLVEGNDGTYLVTHTLMRGPIDMVRAALGDTELCLGVYDSPAALRDLLDVVTEVFLEVAKGQQQIIPPFHGGYCSLFGIWAPGTVVRTQCDVSAFLSPRTYAELVVPFEERICRSFDYSVIHLHSGYLHTVDALLDAEFPAAIQIELDTGSTPVTTRDLVPLCRKILERKPLLLEGEMTLADLEYVLENLPPHGLYLRADLDEDELGCLARRGRAVTHLREAS